MENKTILNFKSSNNSGFTLAELMVATVILVFAFAGTMVTFIRCMELNDMSRNTSLAVRAIETRMSLIKDTAFNQILANFNNVAFQDVTVGNNGRGVSYVDNTNPNLLVITITYCWQQKNGRIVGEDTDLDGAIDGGEDVNGSGMLDSPVQIVSAVYNR